MATKKKFRCGNAPSKGSPWHMSQVKKCNAEAQADKAAKKLAGKR